MKYTLERWKNKNFIKQQERLKTSRVYSTFSYPLFPVVYITRITRSRTIDLCGTSIRLETTWTWQLRLYVDQSEAEERLNDDIFRDIWSPVGHVRPTIFRFIAYASNLHAATSAPHQTSPIVKTRRRSTWIPYTFPDEPVVVGKRCSFWKNV